MGNLCVKSTRKDMVDQKTIIAHEENQRNNRLGM